MQTTKKQRTEILELAKASWREWYGDEALILYYELHPYGDPWDTLQQFEDAYCGDWKSFKVYADEQADELFGLEDLNGPHSAMAQYFDYQKWARDQANDYDTEPSDHGTTYIWRQL